ncbi:MAG: hypothetical protein KKF46_04795 [Nanoarchaeota archaeon]|nr:hypothetical protein [Nanoarchaeota archaeon]MBU1321650.1 hypothetical protein [Nanoarchaeota archaeon]MBU1597591.1 hypothetical protein [Nanoarchaeota archaeon]MBU2441687.1 hypothetical protein [Nanoarchaeota archaeon]
MKEMENHLKKELIKVYEMYLNKGTSKEVVEYTRNVYNNYIPAGPLLSEEIMGFVGRLFEIAYPEVNSGIEPPSKEEVKKIIAELKKML